MAVVQGTADCISKTVYQESIRIISSGMSVFFIQKSWISGWAKTNSIPWLSAIPVRFINPTCLEAGVSAISIEKQWLVAHILFVHRKNKCRIHQIIQNIIINVMRYQIIFFIFFMGIKHIIYNGSISICNLFWNSYIHCTSYFSLRDEFLVVFVYSCQKENQKTGW